MPIKASPTNSITRNEGMPIFTSLAASLFLALLVAVSAAYVRNLTGPPVHIMSDVLANLVLIVGIPLGILAMAKIAAVLKVPVPTHLLFRDPPMTL